MLSNRTRIGSYFARDPYSGIALCYNLGMAIFGGFSPLIASFLINQKGLMIAPAYLLQFAAALTLFGLLALVISERRQPHHD